ncbi:YbhB/YbcL family Raf kinase inhibitor-like protein [Calothrix sp. CCY 0018]|uniref:YbhB/YbcL family Raf kinase inhibitor-like protein n=1 Tax=Calothrix sp. CCY 0018 TaxID=3103864 RepID=UPI0039C5F4B3
MKLESDSFSADGLIPPEFTCDGEAISPSLKWDEPPRETQSLALIVDDPDAPGQTFVHWVLYDIPPKTRYIPQAIAPDAMLDGSGIHGTNDYEQFGYGAPCPPDGTHRYYFKLYALDISLGLAAGASKKDVEAAMEGHIVSQAELIGRYKRQK